MTREGRSEMKVKTGMAVALLAPMALLAGPADKVDPVAEGYPDWQGLSAKSRIVGRAICPSDLRHKVTVVIEVEPNEKLQEQLIMAGGLIWTKQPGPSDNWETLELPRDQIALVSCWGGAKKQEQVMAALKSNDQTASQRLAYFRSDFCSMYDGATFTGAPDSTGKRPYVYVMGPEGKEPLFKGSLNEAALKDVAAAIEKGKKTIAGWDPKWRPFFGNIAEPKFNTSLAKTLEKGKTAKVASLVPVEKALLTDVKSKDAEKAKEAQVLYDALNQTRSDLVLRIRMEAGKCPHRAYYDIQELLKYWPSEKKRVEAAATRIKGNPELEQLAKIFCKVMEWSRPDFTCKNAGAAKKITQELNKMKKTLAKLKESKEIAVQNGAMTVEMKVDELISAIPAKVPAK